MRTRVIPCLTLKDGGVVKTTRFRNPTYVGDPINAVRIFSDSEVDELIVLDITASVERRKPDIARIQEMVAEAFMPVGYGGAIADLATAEKILTAGVEKIIVNTAAMAGYRFVSDLAARFGSQAVVVSIDAKSKLFGGWEVLTLDGRTKTGRDPVSLAAELIEEGAGEVMLTSIDRDGTRQGYDLNLISSVANKISVPVIACGGAGKIDHFAEAVGAGASAVAAGSFFVHHGPHRGVLISYPVRALLEACLP
jgi:cyclase